MLPLDGDALAATAMLAGAVNTALLVGWVILTVGTDPKALPQPLALSLNGFSGPSTRFTSVFVMVTTWEKPPAAAGWNVRVSERLELVRMLNAPVGDKV